MLKPAERKEAVAVGYLGSRKDQALFAVADESPPVRFRNQKPGLRIPGVTYGDTVGLRGNFYT
jgi:hypothetical protein